MNTDKELLELAAKAYGVKLCFTSNDVLINGQQGIEGRWNPLTDDGDALRLAVKLDLFWENIELFDMYFDTKEQDKNKAARTAIVRAAAEIGKTL